MLNGHFFLWLIVVVGVFSFVHAQTNEPQWLAIAFDMNNKIKWMKLSSSHRSKVWVLFACNDIAYMLACLLAGLHNIDQVAASYNESKYKWGECTIQ